jgi:O-antigen/teichoic acid export membrane protein
MNIRGVVASQLDKILLWHFLGAAPLAIYFIAVTPPLKIKDAFKTIGELALPKFSQRSKQELKRSISKKTFKLFLLIVPIVVFYIILAPLIYKILFPQYLDSVIYSQVFIISLLLFPRILLDTSLTAQMRKKDLYLVRTLSPIIQILLLLILLPLYGIWGAIFAILITQISNFGLLLFLFKKM